ncbi:hypothetical protein BJX96DRAFT_143299, partial [Aspergillus floccosus]
MSASDHQNVFPGPSTDFSEFQTVVRPGEASRIHRSPGPYPSSSSSADRLEKDDEGIVKPWKPNPDRRQSWSEQEMRHQFQSHLFDVEEGKKTGFTEVSHEL